MKPIPMHYSTDHVISDRAAQRERTINYLTVVITVAIAVWFFAAF